MHWGLVGNIHKHDAVYCMLYNSHRPTVKAVIQHFLETCTCAVSEHMNTHWLFKTFKKFQVQICDNKRSKESLITFTHRCLTFSIIPWKHQTGYSRSFKIASDMFLQKISQETSEQQKIFTVAVTDSEPGVVRTVCFFIFYYLELSNNIAES